jgi:hypothetical protein
MQSPAVPGQFHDSPARKKNARTSFRERETTNTKNHGLPPQRSRLIALTEPSDTLAAYRLPVHMPVDIDVR